MRHFTCVQDLGDFRQALNEAFEIKKDRFQFCELGKNKTLLMIFFNSSLRTRLSTQKAAMNLGMNTIVLDVNQGAWKLETERGVIMDGDKPEHLLEAVPVMGCYCDVIGVRSFARFEKKEDDYNEKILNQFIQHSGRPVFSMEAATRHPLQSFADLITIEEYKKTSRPKVVMTWAPHPKSLPQAVPNSFAEWMNATDYDFVITHPEGYELDPKFVGRARVVYDQKKAFEGADFVYAWDNAEIGMMDASMAAKIMYAGADASVLGEKAAEYRALQSNVESAAARGYVDTVIAPADTRKYVIGAFEMLFTKREDRPAKKHGTV